MTQFQKKIVDFIERNPKLKKGYKQSSEKYLFVCFEVLDVLDIPNALPLVEFTEDLLED